MRSSRRRSLSVPLLLSLAFHVLLGGFAIMIHFSERPDANVSGIQVVSVAALPLPRTPRVRRLVRPVTADKAIPTRLQEATPLNPVARTELRARPSLAVALPELTPTLARADDLDVAGPTGMDLAAPPSNEGIRADGTGKARVAQETFASFRSHSGLRMSVELRGLSDGDGLGSLPPLELKSPLELVAEHLANPKRTTRRVDVVFLLDISQSMQDNIYAVAKQLERMTDDLVRNELDFRVGIVTFHESAWNAILRNTIEVTPLTRDVERIRRKLDGIKCSGGEKALNAIMAAIDRVRFRDGASRHFVLITDEFVDGDYEPRQIFGALYRAKIQVDVIGMDEPFQRALAARTGGLWIPIDSLTS